MCGIYLLRKHGVSYDAQLLDVFKVMYSKPFISMIYLMMVYT